MSRRKGTADNKEDTEQQIVAIAHKLFMEFGYRAVTTRQIAQACGLTQPALYHHFPDKETLYVEVLRSSMRITRAAMERLSKRQPNWKDGLVEITAYYLLTKPEDMGQMFHDMRVELSAENKKLIEADWREAYLQPLVVRFQEGLMAGALKPPGHGGLDPYSASFMLMSMISHSPKPAASTAIQDNNNIESIPPMLLDPYELANRMVQVMLYGIAH